MNNPGEKSAPNDRNGPLATAIREVKNAAADRDDVVIEMREAERMRLELFAAELAPMIAEIPQDIDLFDFAISSGLQPRFWIDAISQVSMGRDKRTFRFVRDTRLGRVVMAESTDMKTVANKVTHYVAERIVERQRLQEGDVTSARGNDEPGSVAAVQPKDQVSTADLVDEQPGKSPIVVTAGERPGHAWGSLLSGLGLVLLGALTAATFTASYYWDRLDLSRLGLDRLGF